MSEPKSELAFLRSAEHWVCEGYFIDTRYVAVDGVLVDAEKSLWPLPHNTALQFQIEAGEVTAGHQLLGPLPKADLLEMLSRASKGSVTVGSTQLSLAMPDDHRLPVTPESDPWFSPLRLIVEGKPGHPLDRACRLRIDASLRANALPFDGLGDLTSLLGLSTSNSRLSIGVAPPVDLLFAESRFENDRFVGTLHAHPRLELAQVGLAIRGVPGDGLKGRRQLAELITWSRSSERSIGSLDVEVASSNSVLTLLSLGEDLVRRQWYADPRKAPSARFIGLQHFDAELRMIRIALFEAPEGRKFEQAVSLLFFLLGFSSAIPVESNSPDLVVMTPSGQTVVVECTTRLADIATKCGKLVERRSSLSKALAAANLPAAVRGVLVCRLPKDEIAATNDARAVHQLLLLAREELESTLQRVQFLVDPDDLLREMGAAPSTR